MSTKPQEIGQFDKTSTRRKQLRNLQVHQDFVAAAGSRSFVPSNDLRTATLDRISA